MCDIAFSVSFVRKLMNFLHCLPGQAAGVKIMCVKHAGLGLEQDINLFISLIKSASRDPVVAHIPARSRSDRRKVRGFDNATIAMKS